MVATALDAAEESGIPIGLDQILRSDREELLEWAKRQPTVPALGDLSDDNLIVEPYGMPYLIDFEARCVGYLPFCHDPLLLVLRETRRGRPDLMERIMGGMKKVCWRACGGPQASAELQRI